MCIEAALMVGGLVHMLLGDRVDRVWVGPFGVSGELAHWWRVGRLTAWLAL